MRKTTTSGLTGSRQRRDGAALVDCIDTLHEKRQSLQTLAGLLASCRHTPVADLEPEIIGQAGRLMLEELNQMHRTLERLEKEIAAS